MLPMTCIQPPWRNWLVKIDGQQNSRRDDARSCMHELLEQLAGAA